MEVVEQRLKRTDVENRQPIPFLGQHPGKEWEDGRFRLTPCGRRNEQRVFAVEDWPDAEFLQGTKFFPPQRIDDVVPEGGMELFKVAHRFNLMSSTLPIPAADCSTSVSSVGVTVSA